ncbi:MAG: TAXI family TRAP transporter solute-binding subunit [Synergistaceae bacterium]|nr:TAXI family TRAP transporter solute-binding subunit [Synergistaceae bacterium]
MKKKYIYVLASLLTITLSFFVAAPLLAAPDELQIGANKVGSTWYVQAACIADVVKKANPDIKIDAAPIAGGIGNLKLLGQGKMFIALTMDNNNLWAYKGEVLFDKPITNIRTLVGGMDQFYVGIAIRKGSGITSLEDIVKNKKKIRLMTVQRGTTGEASAAHVLEACGMTYDDIKKWGGSVEHTDFEAITNAIKDGRCDVFIQALSKGHPTFTELAVLGKIDLITISPKGLKYLEKYGYTQSILPKDSFKGQMKDLLLPGYRSTLTVTESMDDQTAYKITKAVVEGKDALVKGHKAFEAFIPQEACNPKNLGGVPLHNGAIKYYKEKGYLK